jgi:hypothetical protein
LTLNALKGPTASNPVPITQEQMYMLLGQIYNGL